MRISDWSSDVCSSDLRLHLLHQRRERVQPGCGDGAAAGTRRITPARVEAAPAASFWLPSLRRQGGEAARLRTIGSRANERPPAVLAGRTGWGGGPYCAECARDDPPSAIMRAPPCPHPP